MLKVMIIGAGAISPSHIEGYLEFKDKVQIAAISNLVEKPVTDLIKKYNLKDTKFVSDYREVLDDIDLVSICTPPKTHEKIAIDCLTKGIHVLTEKPMAPSLKACDNMIEAARKGNALISVVAQSRFKSENAKIIKLIHDKELGKVLYTNVLSNWWRGQSYYDLAWRGKWENEGGGCTLNHAVHHIDLLLWANGMPKEVTSIIANLAHNNSEEEDLSLSLLKYDDGSLANLTCSLISHGEEQSLTFQTEKGGLSIPYSLRANESRPNGFPDTAENVIEYINKKYENADNLQYEYHAGQIYDLINAIENGTKLLVDGESGRRTIELITAIYKSGTLGKPVALPLSPEDDFYTLDGLAEHAIHFNEKTKSIEAFEDNTLTSIAGKETKK